MGGAESQPNHEGERLARDARERAKELQCVYAITELTRRRLPLNDMFQQAAERLPAGWQFPEIARAVIEFDDKTYRSAPFEDTAWTQSANIRINDVSRGSVAVCYLEERPSLDEGPFLREERDLIEAVASILSGDVERRLTDEALRERERAARTLMDNLPGMAYRCPLEPEWPMEFLSQGCEALTGYRPEELRGDKLLPYGHIIHPEDRGRVWERVSSAAGRDEAFELEYRIRARDGAEKWVWERGRPIGTNAEGKRILEGFITDITDRKLASQEIERLSKFPEENPNPVMRVDARGVVTYANRAARKLLSERDCEPGQVIAEPWLASVFEAFKSDELQTIEVASDGAFHAFSLAPVPDAGFVNLYGMDISQRKRGEEQRLLLEKQLFQAQKMEAVGQLAGGVAHDFNNIIQAIQGYADLLDQSLEDDEELDEYVSEIAGGAQKAASLTRQLLAFSRRQILEPKQVDLNDIVGGMLKMIGRTIGEHIELNFKPEADIGAIYADAGQIEQILMNLCVNARDAMPEGGELLIETDNVEFDEEYCASHAEALVGEYAMLAVSDTGVGMSPEVQNRIFEPFFSTKEMGKGTGLGLSTVFGIVKQHKGFINVYSEQERGTIFRIYIPVSGRREVVEAVEETAAARGGAETILVAEDDASLRPLTKRQLEDVGYRVLAAATGEEAIDLGRRHIDEIDLALLDVVMPRRGGKEVAEALKRLKPGLPILFCSGYSTNAVHTNFILHEGMALIQKPYPRDKLLRMIREALDKKG